MKGFLEKYNVDEVFLRGVILGLLKNLNERVTYTQINQQQQLLEIYIPFFYSLAGDESFLQDFYLDYLDCDGNSPFAEGNYDIVPRGVITLSGVNIETSSLTNNFVRATYNVEDLQGNMKAFSSYTTSIPLSMTFDVKLRADTLLDTFKIFQSVIQVFYKVFNFSVEFGGMRVPVQVGFPEQYPNDKQLEFSYLNTQKYIETSFTIAVETYYPQKDLATERFRGNLMQAGIRLNISLGDSLVPGNSSLFGGISSSGGGLPAPATNLPVSSVSSGAGSITVSKIGGLYVPGNSTSTFGSLSIVTGSSTTSTTSSLTFVDLFPLTLQDRVLGQNLFVTVSSSTLASTVIPVGITGNSVLIFESNENDVDFYFTGIYI
jgi:hypothetical protein